MNQIFNLCKNCKHFSCSNSQPGASGTKPQVISESEMLGEILELVTKCFNKLEHIESKVENIKSKLYDEGLLGSANEESQMASQKEHEGY